MLVRGDRIHRVANDCEASAGSVTLLCIWSPYAASLMLGEMCGVVLTCNGQPARNSAMPLH